MNKKQNSLIPNLRFKEFKGEWEEQTLGDISETYSGGTPTTSERKYYGGTIPFIRSAEIGKESTELFLTNEGINNSSAKLVNKGNVLIALYGANSGDVAIAKIRGAINQAILCLNSTKSNLFIYQFLTFKKSWIISKYIQGGQGNLSGDIIKSVNLPFPPLPEQKKIASTLSSLDELLSSESEKLSALERHKKGMMQKLFPAGGEKIPEFRFDEFEGNGEWKKRKLNDFIKERSETPIEKTPLYSLTIENGVTPKTKRYERAFLVKDKKEAYKIAHPNDFAYNPMNLRFGAIGRHVGIGKVALSKYYNIFYCDKSVSSFFCEIYFKSYNMINYYNDVAIGSLIEKRRVHFSDFLKFKKLFPSLPEQEKIATTLSSLDALISAQAQKIEELKQHKKGLMQGLFPGVGN